MRKPLIAMLTDTHLKRGNEQQIIDIFHQAIVKSKELGLDAIYFLGDWFDSRKYQSLSTLKATVTILRMFKDEEMHLIAIPGNHDKPNYESEESYLDIFENYDNFKLIRDTGDVTIKNVTFHMLPFFDEKSDKFNEHLSYIEKNLMKGSNVLLTHIAVDGVRNNDGSEMENVCGQKRLSESFDKTLIGHYHDYQELSDGKIVYIGSSHQHNYGEDEFKGLTIMYDNLSIEQVKFTTKEFKVIQIDLSTVPSEQIDELVEKYKDSEDNVRFKMHGPKEKLSSIDKGKFKRLGIDIKVKEDDIDIDLSYTELVDFKGFDPSSILSEWDEFSERKEVDDKMSTNGKERLVKLFQRA